jgi:hypothetical protein
VRIAVAAALAACSIERPDLDGLACPCVSPYACDESTNTCVRQSGDCADEGVITVSNLHAEWEGSAMIYWGWDRAGEVDQIAQHRLYVGEEEDAVRAAACAGTETADVRAYTSEDNAELAQAFLRDTEGMDPVRATWADELDDGTLYFAQLVVIDSAGRTQRSNVAQKRTLVEPSNDHDLLANAPEPFPDCVSPSDAAEDAYDGAPSWRYSPECEWQTMPDPVAVCERTGAPAPECWQNVRWFTDELLSISPGQFNQAFVEFAVRVDDSDHLDWSDARLELGGIGFHVEGFSIRADGAYRVYQIELGRFAVDERRLTPEDLSAPVTLFWVGGELADGAVIHVDGVRVRW